MTSHRTRVTSLLVMTSLVGLFLAACDKPSYIELDPSQMELTRRGEARRVAGRALNHQGRYFPDVMFDWETEDPRVATVDDRGNVTAVTAGNTFVVARARGLEARTRIFVSLVERVEIAEREVNLSVSQGLRYVPEVRVVDAQGRHLTDRRITVRSQDEEIVRVDARGGLHARNPGEADVVVEADGVSSAIKVTATK